MGNHILNYINQLLAYSDSVVTDNPRQRAFDHTRRLQSVPIANPYGNSISLAPGASFAIFDGAVATSLSAGVSQISLALVSATESRYRLSVSGPAGFKTARSVSGINTASVTVNNNAMAVFNFPGSTLTGVVSGDLMRIDGLAFGDIAPFTFNPLNAGLWRVLSVSGTQVSVVRLPNESFEGVTETIASDVSGDVRFYADDGVQVGDSFDITGTLSQPSQKTFKVLSVTPDFVDFISTQPLPIESNVVYISGTMAFYKSSKRLVYIEVDQSAIVRFNEDTSSGNKLTPMAAGDRDLPGFLSKWGDTYRCTVVNTSINVMNVKFFMAE